MYVEQIVPGQADGDQSSKTWKKFCHVTNGLTHFPVLHKKDADRVLAAEVEYINVVLYSHLQYIDKHMQ